MKGNECPLLTDRMTEHSSGTDSGTSPGRTVPGHPGLSTPDLASPPPQPAAAAGAGLTWEAGLAAHHVASLARTEAPGRLGSAVRPFLSQGSRTVPDR